VSIPPNSRRVGNIVAIHRPLDGLNTRAIWATHIYTNRNFFVLLACKHVCCVFICKPNKVPVDMSP